MEEKEEKNLQIRERESRRSGVWNDLRCEAGKSQKYRAERPYEIFLAELISCSRVFDREAEAESRRRWDRIGKPIDGLGKLETMVSKIAGMTGTPDVKIRRKAVAVMCGDHGVVAEGVTQTGQEVTALVAEHIAGGTSAVCLMARAAGADVFAADLGIACEFSSEWNSMARESVLSAGSEDSFADVKKERPRGPERSRGLVKEGCGTADFADESFDHKKFILSPSGRLAPGKIAGKKVSKGTENMMRKPAMTREQAALAVCRGVETAVELAQMGYDIIVTGEMGIGNTTAASAAACCICGLTPEEAVGRGAGLSKEGLMRKTGAVRGDLSLHRPNAEDALDVLSKVGGYDIAGMTGLFLGGAVCGIPVVVDGVISAVSAALAWRLCPDCREFMLASHLGKEPAMKPLLDMLGLSPVICADLALGEGTGGTALLPLLDMALYVYKENVTFEDIHMDAYERMK